jgi:hypothetical protein
MLVDDDDTSHAGLGRMLAGVVCLLLALVSLTAAVVIGAQRFGAEAVELDGIVHHVGMQVDLGQIQRDAMSPGTIIFQLQDRLADGRYQPVFRHQPPMWLTDGVKEKAMRLRPGVQIQITVDQTALEAAKVHLQGRHQLEQSGGIHTPPMLGSTGYVKIIKLEVEG